MSYIWNLNVGLSSVEFYGVFVHEKFARLHHESLNRLVFHKVLKERDVCMQNMTLALPAIVLLVDHGS